MKKHDTMWHLNFMSLPFMYLFYQLLVINYPCILEVKWIEGSRAARARWLNYCDYFIIHQAFTKWIKIISMCEYHYKDKHQEHKIRAEENWSFLNSSFSNFKDQDLKFDATWMALIRVCDWKESNKINKMRIKSNMCEIWIHTISTFLRTSLNF